MGSCGKGHTGNFIKNHKAEVEKSHDKATDAYGPAGKIVLLGPQLDVALNSLVDLPPSSFLFLWSQSGQGYEP